DGADDLVAVEQLRYHAAALWICGVLYGLFDGRKRVAVAVQMAVKKCRGSLQLLSCRHALRAVHIKTEIVAFFVTHNRKVNEFHAGIVQTQAFVDKKGPFAVHSFISCSFA